MSLPYDPYKPPMAPLEGDRAVDPTAAVPASVIDILGRTRPWVKFMSILAFVLTGLITLVGLVILVLPQAKTAQAMAFVPMAVVMFLYVPPAVFLWRYAARIRELERGGGVGALEEALTNQKSFWKYMGILAIVMLGLYLVAGAGGAMFGMMGR